MGNIDRIINITPVYSDRSPQARTSIARRLVRSFIPDKIRHPLVGRFCELRVLYSPDRVYLKHSILPRIGRRGGAALLVGCRRYTAQDPKILKRYGALCWTLDIDPAAARWGAQGRHVVAPIEGAASVFRRAMFDTVVLCGVFGFGVDEIAEQEAAIEACAAILKPGGLLVLGWNSDLVADPARLSGLARDFTRSCDGKDRRVTFRRSTHVFDFHRRRD
jgi:SAM-dependent methyltransferase